jgi:hypothetical protein
MMKLALAVVMSASLVGTAAAQPAPGPFPFTTAAPPPPPGHGVAISFSPVHLAFPILEVTGEVKVAPHIGAGVTLGGGRVSSADKTVTASAYEAGGQLNYYFMDAFEGLHAGGEVLYLKVGDVAQDLSATAEGLSLGPYVGYKVDTSIGFTFVIQGGVAFAAYRAKNSSNTMTDKNVFPLLNLNLGWSF